MRNLKMLMASIIAVTIMTTSGHAIEKLKATEGLRLTAYADQGKMDIGYGHQIKDYEPELKTKKITLAKANELLTSDLRPLELQINARKTGFTQNQFDASADFGYNCGGDALRKSLDVWMKTRDVDAWCKYVSQYVHVTDSTGKKVVHGGLQKRRADNIATFRSAVHPDLKKVAKGAALAVAAVLAGKILFS